MLLATKGKKRQQKEEAPPDTEGNDLLRNCLGSCKKKILYFGPVAPEEWNEKTEGAFCVDCRANAMKNPVKEKAE